MKRILILSLAAAPFVVAGCGGESREVEQTPAVEEVSPTTTPPPAVMPPETTMMQPDTMPNATMPGQTTTPDTNGVQQY